jgi:hypothetical protein
MEQKVVALLLEFLTTDKEQYSNFKLSINFPNIETFIGPCFCQQFANIDINNNI